MRNFLMIISSGLLVACSSINSLQPFDQTQASRLLQQHGETQPAQQMISLVLPQKQQWRKTNSTSDYGSFALLTPIDQTSSRWNESIQGMVLPYENTFDLTAIKLAQHDIQQLKEHCQQVDAVFIKQTAQFVLYRVNTTGCLHDKNQMQVSKIFNGVDGVYVIRYVANSNVIAKQRFMQMVPVIAKAQLVRDVRA